MSSKKKQETHFSLNSPIITIGKQSTSFPNRNANKTEKSILVQKKPVRIPPNAIPYTPPDVIMFALFSAINRKAWARAKKLCYELILYNPLRQDYRDLHDRIDQIIRIINQRLHIQRPVISRTTTANSGNTDE